MMIRVCGRTLLRLTSVLVLLLGLTGSSLGDNDAANSSGGGLTESASESVSEAPEGSDRDLQTILEEGDYQTSYPNGVQARRAEPRRRRISASSAPLSQVFLICAAVFLLFLLATYSVRELRDRRTLEAARAVDPDEAPVELEIPWEDIDELVQQGRFAPAVRQLLQQTFESLAAHQRLVLREAFTSREIVKRLQLSVEGRGALGDLASTVEHSLFGGESVSRSDYERCLTAYHSLVDTLRKDSQTGARA